MMANCKKCKLDRDLKPIAKRDIISELPECLLHHIISFLPTRCAVSTCILSKRWKDRWMATTKLQFSFPLDEPISKFCFFVDRVLHHHSSNITTFDLGIYGSSPSLDTSAIRSWLSAAVNRQVQELVLYIHSPLVISLPLSLCNSNMLTVLKVTSFGCLDIPSKTCLSSLKILHLNDVYFSNGRSFNALFSGLPNIEELKIHSHLWSSIVKNGTISLPTLKRLFLVLFGFDSGKDHFIKVNAENLTFLDFASNLMVDVSLNNMPSLVEGNISIGCGQRWERKAHFATNLLAGFCSAKSLQIKGLEALHHFNSQESLNLFPTFINLTSLKINSSVTSSAAAPLIEILRSAPILESLVIQDVRGGKWSRKPYPQCIQSSLKNCSILFFQGHQADMLFVKFVLKAAKGLESLELCCTKSLCGRQKKVEDIIDKLKVSPRASNCCVIKFVQRKFARNVTEAL